MYKMPNCNDRTPKMLLPFSTQNRCFAQQKNFPKVICPSTERWEGIQIHNKFPKHLLLQGAHAFKRNRGMSLLFLSFSIATHIICDATEILVRDKQQERAQSFSSISRSIQSSSIYAHCLLSFDSPFCRFRRCLIDRSINLYIKATKR